MADLSGLLPVTTFFRCTMFGWRHCCSTRISRMEVTGMPASNAGCVGCRCVYVSCCREGKEPVVIEKKSMVYKAFQIPPYRPSPAPS